jgi:hypothetical protein
VSETKPINCTIESLRAEGCMGQTLVKKADSDGVINTFAGLYVLLCGTATNDFIALATASCFVAASQQLQQQRR